MNSIQFLAFFSFIFFLGIFNYYRNLVIYHLVTYQPERIRSLISTDPFPSCFDSVVLATAASATKFKELKNFVGSAHVFDPGRQILVLNLGLTKRQYLQTVHWKNVQVINFPFPDYPIHVRNLWNFAWKAIVIQIALTHYPFVFYFDSGIELHNPIKNEISDFCKTGYFLVKASNPKLNARYIHEGTLTWLNITLSEIGGISAIMRIGGIQAWKRDNPTFHLWLSCLLNESCIAPVGSGIDNHLQDQSALTAITIRNGLVPHERIYDISSNRVKKNFSDYPSLPWVVTRQPRKNEYMKSVVLLPMSDTEVSEIDWGTYQRNFGGVLELSHPKSDHILLNCLWKNKNDRDMCRREISATTHAKG